MEGNARREKPAGCALFKKTPQTRQKSSCTKCRERKVKCDKLKPCTSCNTHNNGKQCHYEDGEEGDRVRPQAHDEVRRLRKEQDALKREKEDLEDQLQLARTILATCSCHSGKHSYNYHEEAHRRSVDAHTQKRIRIADSPPSLYFGFPALSTVTRQFASLDLGSNTLTHPAHSQLLDEEEAEYPKYDLFVSIPEESTYDWLYGVLSALPREEGRYRCMLAFEKRVNSFTFPYSPDRYKGKLVERCLSSKDGKFLGAPERLAFSLAALALGMQSESYREGPEIWHLEALKEADRIKADQCITVAMQKLRASSFLSRATLLTTQTLVLICEYLFNRGRVITSYSIFGCVVRSAHLINLHRNLERIEPRTLPLPTSTELADRQWLWWWILHLDSLYSCILQRPMGITSYGDCVMPEPRDSNPEFKRLHEHLHRFTITTREILASESFSNTKVDKMFAKLEAIWKGMPDSLRFDRAWLKRNESPEEPIDTSAILLSVKHHMYLLRLFEHCSPDDSTTVESPASNEPRRGSCHSQPAAPLRYARERRVQSALSIVYAFKYMVERAPHTLIDWTFIHTATRALLVLIRQPTLMMRPYYMSLVKDAVEFLKLLRQRQVHNLIDRAVQSLERRLQEAELTISKRLGAMSSSGGQWQQTSKQDVFQPDDDGFIDGSATLFTGTDSSGFSEPAFTPPEPYIDNEIAQALYQMNTMPMTGQMPVMDPIGPSTMMYSGIHNQMQMQTSAVQRVPAPTPTPSDKGKEHTGGHRHRSSARTSANRNPASPPPSRRTSTTTYDPAYLHGQGSHHARSVPGHPNQVTAMSMQGISYYEPQLLSQSGMGWRQGWNEAELPCWYQNQYEMGVGYDMSQ